MSAFTAPPGFALGYEFATVLQESADGGSYLCEGAPFGPANCPAALDGGYSHEFDPLAATWSSGPRPFVPTLAAAEPPDLVVVAVRAAVLVRAHTTGCTTGFGGAPACGPYDLPIAVIDSAGAPWSAGVSSGWSGAFVTSDDVRTLVLPRAAGLTPPELDPDADPDFAAAAIRFEDLDAVTFSVEANAHEVVTYHPGGSTTLRVLAYYETEQTLPYPVDVTPDPELGELFLEAAAPGTRRRGRVIGSSHRGVILP